ncbi:RTA1 like protein-domain-containing protein [Xylaria sp. FL1777]|nr:RTA1 like protein-domain-containing protein [Xylaria sp. FL1777]
MAVTNPITCVSADCSRVFLLQPPTLAGNAVLLALFAILIPLALLLGFRYRSLGFATAVATGLSLEVLGYIGRLLLRSHDNNRADFAIFLIGTILGPTCICGAMFWVAPRIIAVYGEEYRSWRPVWYLALLSVLTIVSLVFEFAGSIASTAQDAPIAVETGVRVIVVGLALQLVAFTIFVLHGILFAIALLTRQHGLDPKFASVYRSTPFKTFLATFTSATALVILRTAYRTIQVAEGFQSSIAQAETPFLILDGAAMLVATMLLLVCFPARALGRSWPETSTQRLSREPLRPIHHEPSQFHVTRPGPTYSRMNVNSPMHTYAPRTTNHWTPPARRAMVDTDDLW